MLISSDKPEKQGSKQFLLLKYFWSVKDYPTFSNIFVSRIGNNKRLVVPDRSGTRNKAETARHNTSVRNVVR